MSVTSDLTSILGDPPRDPSNDQQPDYSLPEHEEARRATMESEDCDDTQAAASLTFLWKYKHAQQMAAWNAHTRRLEEEEARRLDEELRRSDEEDRAPAPPPAAPVPPVPEMDHFSSGIARVPLKVTGVWKMCKTGPMMSFSQARRR